MWLVGTAMATVSISFMRSPAGALMDNCIDHVG
jgi:hypothetical protein